MANLSGVWHSFKSRFADLPIDAVGAGTDTLQAIAGLAKELKEQSGNLEVLKPLIASAPLLFDVLNSPAVQVVAAGVPFLSVGTTLLKLCSQGSKRDLGWEECALLVASAAYMESLPKFLKDKEVLDQLNEHAVSEQTEKELGRLRSLEFDERKARDSLIRFHSSDLAQACNAALVANLKAGGLDEQQALLLAERVARDAQGSIRIAISELGDSVKLLATFFSIGGAEQLAQDQSLKDYLSKLAKGPEEQVFGDRDVQIKDIYVPVRVELLNPDGTQKSTPTQTVVLEEWVREIVDDNLDADKIIFVQGEPGRGKSVFCRMFAEWVGKKRHPLWTPVLVRLKDIRTFKDDFEDTLGHSINRKFAEGDSWLSDGRRYLFFLDGFDELVLQGRSAPDLKRFLKDVGDFQKRCNDSPEKGHRVLLTGRPLALYGVEYQEMPKNLLRARILPFDDSLHSVWLDKWGHLVGSDKMNRFKEFIGDERYPQSVKDLSREPMLLYLVAAMHRDGRLRADMFRPESADQTKLLIYEKTLDWALSQQRSEELNYELTGKEKAALKNILAEAGLCSFQAGGEQAPLAMVAGRLERDGVDDLHQQAELTSALATFYLQEFREPDHEGPTLPLTGSVEFIHKSFGEFLCARKIAQTLKGWTKSGVSTADIEKGIYDLLGPRLLTPEVVGYLMAMLSDFYAPQRQELFSRLKVFYFCWQGGEFLNREPNENFPQKKYLELKELVPANLRSIEVNTGLNALLLLLQLRVQAASLAEELSNNFLFNPCCPNGNDLDSSALRRTIHFADSVELGLFRDGLGAFMQLADLRGADLSWAFLQEIDLSAANLSEADLSRTELYNANLSGANLSEANLSGGFLQEVNLSEANLSGAELVGANLSEANLIGANLCRADLTVADLSSANLSGADLGGADLSGADLRRVKHLTPAQVRAAVISKETQFDDELSRQLSI